MKIVFDAQPIVEKRTGIGRYTLNLIQSCANASPNDTISPFYFNFRRNFKEQSLWNKYQNIKPYEVNWIPGVVIHNIWKHISFPPIDLFTSKADIFQFTNFITKPCLSGKKILNVYDLTFKRYPETLMEQNLRRINDHFLKSLKESDAVLTISKFSKDEFHHFYPDYKKPVFVTHLGIDEFLGIQFSEQKNKTIQSKYKLPESYMLYVGTIEPRKNLMFLLDVMNELNKTNPDIKLVIVGSKGWSNQDFFKKISELKLNDQIIFPGFIEEQDLSYLYRLSKLFIFPTLYEGFGMPPLEAMACNTPVVASKITVMQEVLEDAAHLIDLKCTPQEWAKEIYELVQNENALKKYSQKGLSHSQKFTWNQTAKETLNIYKQLIG